MRNKVQESYGNAPNLFEARHFVKKRHTFARLCKMRHYVNVFVERKSRQPVKLGLH